MTENTTKLLEETRRVLLENGWCQGKFRDGDRRCLLGAVSTATHNLSLPPALYDRVSAVFYEVIDESTHGTIVGFNDDPNTTFNDVMKVLDEAILQAKGEELS